MPRCANGKLKKRLADALREDAAKTHLTSGRILRAHGAARQAVRWRCKTPVIGSVRPSVLLPAWANVCWLLGAVPPDLTDG
jgi:hypothetical protein